VVKATDGEQNLVWDAERKPFGEREVTTAQVEMPLGFPGQYYDEETNNYYNYFRDYDPSTGRYLQSDPIGLAGGINTYAYVGGNPLSKIDPKGEAGVAGTMAAGVGLGALGAFLICINDCMDQDGDGKCDKVDYTEPDSRGNLAFCMTYCTSIANLVNTIADWPSVLGAGVGESIK
jgi:RHS repeat-associated protein